jgi:hypothetical protein
MFNPEIDMGNVITILEEDLKEDQKQAMEKAMEDYRQLYLKSFSLNRSREVSRSKICCCLGRLPLTPILVNFKRWLILQ